MKITLLYSIISEVLSLPPHEEIFYHKGEIPDPTSMGFEESIGEPVGQLADYRLPLEDGRSVHSRIYDNRIGFHWDKVHPHMLEDCLEHFRRDSPIRYTTLCGLAGAGLGALATAPTKKKDVLIKSSIFSGLLGLSFGILTAEWE